MTIKAIETEYNGYRFRSRLEARWAVFFDTAGIKYEYEPEGHELSNGDRYLPDFFLPELDAHVEVKAKRPGYEREITRIQDFIEWGGPIKQVVILSDVPYHGNSGGLWHFPAYYWRGLGVDAGWWFFSDRADSVGGHVSRARYTSPNITQFNLERGSFSIDPVSDFTLKGLKNWDRFCGFTAESVNENVFSALKAARQARFEYGETPMVKPVFDNGE